MATSLATRLTLILSTSYKTTDVDLSEPTATLTYDLSDALANGKGLNKAECIWADEVTVDDGGFTFDFFPIGIADEPAGPVAKTDAFGTALSMDQLKGILLHNTSTATGEYVTVGGSAAQSLALFGADTHTIRLQPNGIFFWWAPGADADNCTIGAGTNDELLLTAAAGKTPTVEFVFIGENN